MLPSYLCHVDEAQCQGLIAQNGAVLVPLPPLQHDLQSVGISLQKMWILEEVKMRDGEVDRIRHALKSCTENRISGTFKKKYLTLIHNSFAYT